MLASQIKYYVYILTCKNNTVFYVGVTNNLVRRVYEHKSKLIEGFTARYNIDRLQYFEEYFDPLGAINREKQIKKYSQAKKIGLIQSVNPGMMDTYESIINT